MRVGLYSICIEVAIAAEAREHKPITAERMRSLVALTKTQARNIIKHGLQTGKLRSLRLGKYTGKTVDQVAA